MNTLSELMSSHLVLLPHLSFTHLTGSVNLNYCSIFAFNELHSMHLKEPMINSGFTSVVLVMVPWMDMSLPRAKDFNSLSLFTFGML